MPVVDVRKGGLAKPNPDIYWKANEIARRRGSFGSETLAAAIRADLLLNHAGEFFEVIDKATMFEVSGFVIRSAQD
jgi:hypothetical protein